MAATGKPQPPSDIPRVFEHDLGARQVYAAGLGVWPDSARRIGGATVTLRWVYADLNQLLAYYTIEAGGGGQGDARQPNPMGDCWAGITLLGPASSAFQVTGGAGSVGVNGTIQCLQHRNYLALNVSTLSLRLTPSPPRSLQGSTSDQATPNAPDESEPASFEVSLPVLPGRVAEPNQTGTLRGQPITLARVVVSPSQMRVYLDGPGSRLTSDQSGRTPGAASSMSFAVNGWDPIADGHGGMFSVGGLEAHRGPTDQRRQGPQGYAFGYPDYDRPGEWTLTVTVHGGVGSGPPTLADSCTFHFTLPTVT